MDRAGVCVPIEALEGLEAVRLSGKTNMLDVPRVVELALEMGYDADVAESARSPHGADFLPA